MIKQRQQQRQRQQQQQQRQQQQHNHTSSLFSIYNNTLFFFSTYHIPIEKKK